MLVAVGLGACAGPRRGSASLAQTADSATNGCRHSPSLCAGADAVVPMPRAVQVAVAVAGARAMLDEDTRRAVEEVLKQCADDARSEVLVQQHGGKSPTREECSEVVEFNSRGEAVTRAMKWGTSMHQFALECARQRLDAVIPGRFSLEPTYRYDRGTPRTTHLTQEEVNALLRQGRGAELKGTLVPDVVIHEGNPLQAQSVYDFKFPCVNGETAPPWRRYPRGHPYEGESQDQLYREALRLLEGPLRVMPRMGVVSP
ncbi:Lipoprotein [Corallococcus soli]